MLRPCSFPIAGVVLLAGAVRIASAQETAPPPPAQATSSAVLASEETNWPGIVAELTGLRRKGSTLTARVRLKNGGSDAAQPEIEYGQVYVLDAGGGKKYEVLRDEKGVYIAALHSGFGDRWYAEIAPGQQQTIWIKFPAPPADVKSVTLQLPGVPPLEDVTIQDP